MTRRRDAGAVTPAEVGPGGEDGHGGRSGQPGLPGREQGGDAQAAADHLGATTRRLGLTGDAALAALRSALARRQPAAGR